MRGANSKPSRSCGGHDDLGVAVGVGVAGSRIQLGVVFHQAVEHEGGFPQPARDRLLVEPQAVVGGVGVTRHASALEHAAVVGRQKVNGHIEAHPVGRAALSAAVHPA